ncbi:MAG: HAMP domain-containing sensor histidine kinase [Lachnospiraceae bacterium]|nr:HAMP domain-containing sensor histidine kinase [Lachnospiraceae bacterium]
MIKKIFAPLEELSNASKQVAQGDFTVQIEYKGEVEELKSTIDNFNRMVNELNSVEIMRKDFVANVSHEFKTPLSAITGYATLLQSPQISESEKENDIQRIIFNIEKLNDMTDNILRLSKLERQQYMEKPKKYRLDEQIRESIVLLEPKWSAKKQNFELELPEIEYCGQMELLLQVWMNLIGNAIKYSDIGADISVKMSVGTHSVKVKISDNGIGMTDETIRHMFEMFYQGDTSRKSQGNGLGLALCKKIVELCNGKIYVESELGVGTVFIIKLPMEDLSQ